MKRQKKIDDNIYDAILEITLLIPPGRVTTYGTIAKAAGHPTGARMVARAMGMRLSDQPDVKIPVFRVVSSGGFLKGEHDNRQKMLEAEGHEIKNDKIVDFKKVFWDPLEEI